jgi:hypothetical protein
MDDISLLELRQAGDIVTDIGNIYLEKMLLIEP